MYSGRLLVLLAVVSTVHLPDTADAYPRPFGFSMPKISIPKPPVQIVQQAVKAVPQVVQQQVVNNVKTHVVDNVQKHVINNIKDKAIPFALDNGKDFGLGVAGGFTGTGAGKDSLAGKIGRITGAVGMGALQGAMMGAMTGDPNTMVLMAVAGGVQGGLMEGGVVPPPDQQQQQQQQRQPSEAEVKAAVNAAWAKMTPNERYDRYMKLPPNGQAQLWAILTPQHQFLFNKHALEAQEAMMFQVFLAMQYRMMQDRMMQQQMMQVMAANNMLPQGWNMNQMQQQGWSQEAMWNQQVQKNPQLGELAKKEGEKALTNEKRIEQAEAKAAQQPK